MAVSLPERFRVAAANLRSLGSHCGYDPFLHSQLEIGARGFGLVCLDRANLSVDTLFVEAYPEIRTQRAVEADADAGGDQSGRVGCRLMIGMIAGHEIRVPA